MEPKRRQVIRNVDTEEGEPARSARSALLVTAVENYRPRSETFLMRYGHYIMAIPAMYTGFTTQRFFNKSFKFAHKGMVFSYLPATFLSGLFSGLTHRTFIAEYILTDSPTCQGCKELQCASFHILSGVLWTYLISGLIASMVGSLTKSTYVPPIDKRPLEAVKFMVQKYRSFIPLGSTLLLGNIAYSLILAGLETREFRNIKARLETRLDLAKLADPTATTFDVHTTNV